MPVQSVLSFGQRRLFAVIALFAVFILANSVYLYIHNPKARLSEPFEKRYEVSNYGMAGSGDISDTLNKESTLILSSFYQSMLLAHVLIGIGLFGIVAGFVIWHIRDALKRNNRKAVFIGSTLAVCALLITLSGFFILTESNSEQNRWIFHGHRFLAILIPLLYFAHRRASSMATFKKHLASSLGLVGGLTLLMVMIHHETLPELEPGTIQTAKAPAVAEKDIDAQEPRDPFIPFQPNNLGAPDSPFFPSRVTTESGGFLDDAILTQQDYVHQDKIDEELERYGFLVSQTVGSQTCARCHAGIVEQWSKSAHRFSSFNNPYYKAGIDQLRKAENGWQRSQWCAGCHDPALLFTGNMMKVIDPHSPLAQAGLTCLSCHIIDQLHGKEGNGNYRLASLTPSTYLFADSKSGVARLLGDMVIKSKPTVHKNRLLKPFFRSSEYCLTCHKVSLDEPVNHYRWLRGQNEYDNWHDSGVALNASRTFYLPSKKRSCQDCHMPLEEVELPDVSAKNGKVKSHRFLAVNTALPYLRGDMETVQKIERDLQDNKMGVDIFSIRIQDQNAIHILDPNTPYEVSVGTTVQVEVVVRNYNVGHTFPGGTNDSNQAWIAFQVLDQEKNRWFESGFVDENGRVDPYAHFYKALFVDRNGEPALRRNAQDFHALVYARVIGPGSADVVRFRFTVPDSAGGKSLSLSAKLLWRKFNQSFNRFVFEHEKVPDLPHLQGQAFPDLPITPIAADLKTMRVVDSPGYTYTLPSRQWMRANDYGIAHFLDRDFQTAEWAFEQVANAAPERLDGTRNLARVAIEEGRIEAAYRYLEACENLKPGDPQTAWLYGLARQKDGRYEEAVQAYQRVLAHFPEDRAAWQNLGQSYYRNGQFEEALNAYLEVLKIDPEDRTAHYHRMLIYRALGKPDLSREAEKAYLKYKIDESAAAITQQYRLNHPADNNASQTITVYDLEPLTAQTILESQPAHTHEKN